MSLEIISLLLLFPVIAAGPAWPLVARLNLEPAERLTVSVVLSLLGAYLLAWLIYLLTLPVATLWVLPALGLAGFALRRRALVETVRQPAVRTLLFAQGLLALWCLGWLALVPSYSGGMWMGDWFGHWQRTVFFLGQQHENVLFNGFDPLTSRPPLVNVLVGAFLRDRPPLFASYQVIMTLLGCLAFLPAALLASRWGGRRAVPLLAVLLMLNPLFVQNATYAWTKLPAAFFLLAALYFFLRARGTDAPPSAGLLFAVSLALGILAHYSAGPYAVLLAAGWLGLRPGPRDLTPWLRFTAGTALAGVLVLATWFGWTLAAFGVDGTFLTNTTITDRAVTPGAQVATMLLNVRDTLVPHFLRPVDFTLLAQTSVSGWWRDWCFQLYQLNLFFAFGCLAWLVILRELLRAGLTATREARRFWVPFVPAVVILGIIVHSGRDTWGLVHICLQPLILLGIAFLAARWPSLGPAWRRVLLAGAVIDLLAGIFLHFAVQRGLIDRWLAPPDSSGLTAVYSLHAQYNLQAKLTHQWVFAGDLFASFVPGVLAGLTFLLVAALVLAARGASASPAPR
ncbi:MAG TPA: hypothetical protein VHN79_11260 [Lacunisphaera sp.]|nr:hypothetical protein [Lacunisphaera sp.]